MISRNSIMYFNVEEIRNYLASQDSFGDAIYRLKDVRMSLPQTLQLNSKK